MSLLSRKSALFLATLILLLAAALRLAQLSELPPGLHYDEAADTIIAREIAEGRSAPIFVEAYTGKEVLFFYWAAAWMKLLGATPFAMRLAAATMGVLTIAATYWAVREMFSTTRSRSKNAPATMMALLAAAFMTTSFWHVLMSRLGFRSIAEPCAQALALAALWRGVRLNQRGWLLAGGGLIGLNLYTYLAARLFPITIALLFFYLIVVDTSHRRERLIQFGWVVAAAAVVFTPLGVYFLQNPDAFLTRIAQVAPREGQSAELWANIVRASGMFFVDGDPYVRFNLPGRPLFPAILGVLFIIGVVAAIAGAFRSKRLLRRAAYFFLLTSTLIMLLPAALAVNEITPSNLRAIGMMPMGFVSPALGTWLVIKRMSASREGTLRGMKIGQGFFVFRHAKRSFVGAMLALVLMLTAVETGLVYFVQYTRLPQLYYTSDGDLVEIANLLNRFDAPDTPLYIHALHYRHPTLAALARNFHTFRSISGPDVVVFPPGKSVQVFARLALPDRVWLARFLPGSARSEVVSGPDGQTSFEIVEVDSAPSIELHTPLVANFGNTIELVGYELGAKPGSGGEADVTLFWQVIKAPDRGDYATFVELRDAWGFQWGRADSFDYPSEQWSPGEMIVQRLRVPVAAGAPRGDYQLDAGWYSAGADKRLSVVAAGGGFGGTIATLAPIAIARAARPPDDKALGMGTRIDTEMLKGLTLLGASLETPVAPQGAPVFFTLFWRGKGGLADTPVEVRLLEVGESASGSASGDASYNLSVGAPVHGTYPFDEWTAGEVVADRYGLRIPAEASAGDYALEARVGRGEWVRFGALRVEATQRRFDAPPIAHPLDVAFGDQIELLGYDLDRSEMRAGESVTLTLVWRALRSPDADYTVFTHLLDAAGAQRGGRDNPPLNGAYNTSRWVAGEVIVDAYVIPLAADAPPGEYAIEIGLYRFDTGARLPLSSGGDALRLATIQVTP